MAKLNKMARLIRRTMKADERTLYRLAKDSGLPYQTIHRFYRGEHEDLWMRTASALCETLGLELRPKMKGGK